MVWLIISIALFSFWFGTAITEYTYMCNGADNLQRTSNVLDIISVGSFMGGIVCIVIWLRVII